MIDRLSRVYGVSDVTVFGSREYSMRIWLNPDRLSHFNMDPDQVVAALREQYAGQMDFGQASGIVKNILAQK